MKIGFVVLHYLTEEDTKNCISSIKKTFDNKELSIVIVDNYSHNGSLEKLEESYKNDKRIHIIKNQENLGFARGNNVGYDYCRNVLKCNSIVICNNDIEFISKNIRKKIEQDLKDYNAAVIGPDIISKKDGGHQNPMQKQTLDIKALKKEVRRYRVLSIINKVGLYDLLKYNKQSKKNEVFTGTSTKVIGEQLHGACLIFTPIFVKNNEVCFCNKTFLYMEETLLKIKCDRNGQVMLYDPEIVVYHKEDSSTNKLNSSSKKKRAFVFKNMVDSIRILISEIEKGDKE